MAKWIKRETGSKTNSASKIGITNYAGWIFDRTESYTLVLITFSIILLIASTFFAILRHPSPPNNYGEELKKVVLGKLPGQ